MIKKIAGKLLKSLGYKVLPISFWEAFRSDIHGDAIFQEIFNKCQPFTVTSH